ncbi:MAG: pyruvate ferredoxin oxidoreductase, partial [Verrucomicrobiae bacterium]|nr:pyruvate ferredoxin oxidoreductase [Verrucomicrobiae bacterium]
MSRALMSGRPIKIFVLDTQVYSNTGGQACTSGFVGQVSDMAPYGKVWHGKTEIRKEMALIGAAHRTAFILQGNVANVTHLIEGYIDGINTRRPALFSIYAVCQPEHGVPDDGTAYHSKMALESRAYPVFRFDPDAGDSWEDCISLDGNPAMDNDWPVYQLNYQDEDGVKQVMEVPMTFADFAVQEGRFRKHFRVAPPDAWNENMVPLTEFLELEEDDREGRFPYIWSVNKKNHLIRVIVSQEIVRSTEERRDYWRTLKGLAGLTRRVDPVAIANQVRSETAQKLAQGLMQILAGDAGAPMEIKLDAPSSGTNGSSTTAAPAAAAPPAASGAFEPAWIDQTECTSCDECTTINSKIFQYDENKKAFVKNPRGGPYKDIVRAA